MRCEIISLMQILLAYYLGRGFLRLKVFFRSLAFALMVGALSSCAKLSDRLSSEKYSMLHIQSDRLGFYLDAQSTSRDSAGPQKIYAKLMEIAAKTTLENNKDHFAIAAYQPQRIDKTTIRQNEYGIEVSRSTTYEDNAYLEIVMLDEELSRFNSVEARKVLTDPAAVSIID